MDDSETAAGVFRRFIEDEDREHFVIALVNARLEIVGLHTVSIGTINATMVSAREVFKIAILCNAASIVAAHNHPTGDPTPSPEDIEITKVLRKAGDLLDIPMLDRVIVGTKAASHSSNDLGTLTR